MSPGRRRRLSRAAAFVQTKSAARPGHFLASAMVMDIRHRGA
jgi:hypothetical protein